MGLNINSDIEVESFPVGTLGCNCSVIVHKPTREAIIIDPGNDYQHILKYVESKKLNVTQLLHTHAHFDHIGQSGAVKAATGAKMHLHKGDLFLYQALGEQGRLFGQHVGDIVPIDDFLRPEQTFEFGQGPKEFMKTLHTPGHTPGSCCFYTEIFETPFLFAGDTLFQRSIGRTDLPGGDHNQILTSIKDQLLKLPDETVVIPGHGPVTRIFEERRENPFLH